MATEETTKDPDVTALRLTRAEASALIAALARSLAGDFAGCADLVTRRRIGPDEGPIRYQRARLVFVVDEDGGPSHLAQVEELVRTARKRQTHHHLCERKHEDHAGPCGATFILGADEDVDKDHTIGRPWCGR